MATIKIDNLSATTSEFFFDSESAKNTTNSVYFIKPYEELNEEQLEMVVGGSWEGAGKGALIGFLVAGPEGAVVGAIVGGLLA